MDEDGALLDAIFVECMLRVLGLSHLLPVPPTPFERIEERAMSCKHETVFD